LREQTGAESCRVCLIMLNYDTLLLFCHAKLNNFHSRIRFDFSADTDRACFLAQPIVLYHYYQEFKLRSLLSLFLAPLLCRMTNWCSTLDYNHPLIIHWSQKKNPHGVQLSQTLTKFVGILWYNSGLSMAASGLQCSNAALLTWSFQQRPLTEELHACVSCNCHCFVTARLAAID
jgi:hypothetical protein